MQDEEPKKKATPIMTFYHVPLISIKIINSKGFFLIISLLFSTMSFIKLETTTQ